MVFGGCLIDSSPRLICTVREQLEEYVPNHPELYSCITMIGYVL